MRLNNIIGRILYKTFYIILTGAVFLLNILPNEDVFAAPPSNFQTSQIIGSGLANPTGFDIAPDGRIFVLNQGGQVRIYKNGQMLPTPFITLPTSLAGGDLGLLGIAFDPDFHVNKYVYFYYTSNDGHNTIARYDATNDVAFPNHLIVYHSDDDTQEYHAGGTIRFGPDKKLYLSIGDDLYPANSQDLSNPKGKILRLNKDGSIPSDNPFFGQSGKDEAIWAYGFRNPFRMQFDNNGRLYVGDVGEKAFEEINVVSKGSNYGWPTCEGSCSNPGMKNPLYQYSHNGTSNSVTGGLVYTGSMFPAVYQGRYFFGDYGRGFIKNLTLDGSGNFVAVNDFDNAAGTVVDMKQASDGSIYYLTIFPARLFQVTYSTSNHVPVALSSSNVTSGPNPLTVNFSSSGSNDPDGSSISYNWNFGDGTGSTTANPTKIYSNPGTYTVNLTVSDGLLQSQATPIVISAGTPPTLNVSSPVNNSQYRAGDTIMYNATATASNGQTLPDSAFTVEVQFHHDTHIHPFYGPITGNKSGQFVIPDTGHNATDTWYEIIISARDINGLVKVKSTTIVPQIVNINLATNPSGQKVLVDSQVYSTPQTIQSVAGFKRELNVSPMQLIAGTYYQFDNWSDGGAMKHYYTTPTTNSTITANLKTTPPFSVTYFNNKNLSGTPVLTRNEGMIDYDFGNNSPASGVNSDNFSIRYVKQHYFQNGSYRFDTLSDDGVRLFIDGNILIDKWVDQGSTPYSGNIDLTEGNHEIKFEYFDAGGGANVTLNWDMQTSGVIQPPEGQSVSSFSLINANTDQVISGYEQITNGTTLTLSSLPTTSLNIRANTNPSTVGSVRFGYDGNSNYQTETNPPYALGSDDNGNYYPWTPSLGSHTVTATPYTGSGASGTAGTPLSIIFVVAGGPTPTPTGQSVSSFSLINADNDQVISGFNPILAGSTLNLSSLPTRNLNIRANTLPATVGSVRFGYDGNTNYQTETNSPYAFASDDNGNYYPWTPTVGSHTVTATPYTGSGASGNAGTPLSITFVISDGGGNPTPTPTPTPTPSGQAVTSFSLINADNDQVISAFSTISNGTVISLNSLPTRNLNIRANTNPSTVGSVRFGYDGNSNFGTENNAPYAFASDDNGNYYPWTPTVGSHTVTATPYSGQNASGTTGAQLSIQIIINN